MWIYAYIYIGLGLRLQGLGLKVGNKGIHYIVIRYPYSRLTTCK